MSLPHLHTLLVWSATTHTHTGTSKGHKGSKRHRPRFFGVSLFHTRAELHFSQHLLARAYDTSVKSHSLRLSSLLRSSPFVSRSCSNSSRGVWFFSFRSSSARVSCIVDRDHYSVETITNKHIPCDRHNNSDSSTDSVSIPQTCNHARRNFIFTSSTARSSSPASSPLATASSATVWSWWRVALEFNSFAIS